MKQFRKAIAVFLIACTLLTVLASCVQRGEKNEESQTTGEEIVEVLKDTWDEDELYTGVENDKALDTNGTATDGSIFDSFQHNIFWSVRDQDKSYLQVSCKDGIMKMTVPKGELTNARYLQRTITPFKSYEVEFKLRLGYAGWHNGFFIQANNTRTMFHIYENKIRVNNPDDPGNSYKIYADIGTDWHVYRMVNYNGIASLYMDGRLLLTFEVNYYNSSVPQMSFYAATGGKGEDGFIEVDYVSYKNLADKNLSIVTPTNRQSFVAGTNTLDVTCSVSEALKATENPLEFYLNGVYAGQTSVSNPKMTFNGIHAGTYRVQVKCGDATSEECVFTVERSRQEVAQNSQLSTAQKLQSSYVLSYTVSGDGTVLAGDGMHALELRHTGNKLTYASKNGEQTANGGTGSYIAVVDGGVTWLYRNGKMIASYILPHKECATTATVSGAVADMKISAHNATLFRKDCSDGQAFSTDTGALPASYALEFEYTKGQSANLVLCDGAYLLSVSLEADGIAKGYVAEQNVSYAPLFETVDGSHFYRIYVSGGLAQIFIDNVWTKSYCLPTTVIDRGISVSGSGLGMVQIRETNDQFFFSANATDADWNDYFTLDGEKKAYTLKAYAKNTTLEADLTVSDTASGHFCLVARYDRGRGIIAGYDFDSRKFVMGTSYDALVQVGSGTVPTSAKLKLTVEGNRAVLYCNGTQVGILNDPKLSGATDTWHGSETSVNGWGNVGYSNQAPGVSITAFSYEGDGNAVKSATSNYLKSYHTVTVVELGKQIWICSGTGIPWKSDDNGLTFTEARNQPVLNGCVFNTIVLKSGNVLTLVYKKEGDGYINYAYVYKPDGKTLVGGPYKVQEEPLSYRQTQNGRVMQTSSGRIIFVAGECPNEQTGGFAVFYTDREGYMWKRANTPMTLASMNLALCEGDAVELEVGHLRMFARSELGYLYYFDSYDNGETWDVSSIKPSCFPSVSSCFGIEKDPQTGALYMAWEYNNNNDNSTVQYPRSRAALAVSYNNGATWYYVGDMDEANHSNTSTWVHMNLGLSVTSDAVYVTVAKRSTEAEDVWYNYMVRVEKSDILPMVRFNSVHAYRDPLENEPAADAVSLPLGGTMLIAANSLQVYASGETFTIDRVDGKRTKLTAEMIAAMMSGTLQYRSDGAAVITVGAAESVFVPNSDEVIVNGKTVKVCDAVISEQGTIKVTVGALDEALSLTAKQTSSGSIVLSFGKVPVNPDVLFANAGI